MTRRRKWAAVPGFFGATAHELTRGFYAKAFGWEFTNYGPDYSATTNGTTDLGLNGLQSSGQLPNQARMDSSKAIREMNSIHDERHASFA